MVTLALIGHVRSSRTNLSDDNWGSVTAQIELVEAFPSESAQGVLDVVTPPSGVSALDRGFLMDG